jgi:hypothetical protein
VTVILTSRSPTVDTSGMRRKTLTLLLVVSLVLTAAAAAATPTRTLRVADAKLTFAVPKSWASVDPRTVASSASKELRRENPQLGAILDELARPGSPVRLVAFDPATSGGFVTNVNVVVTRVPSSLGFDAYRLAILGELRRVPGLVGTPTATAVTLPAGRAVRTHVRASVVVKGRTLVADLNQIAFLRDGRSIVITFTTAVAAARKTAPVIARASKSIRFGS